MNISLLISSNEDGDEEEHVCTMSDVNSISIDLKNNIMRFFRSCDDYVEWHISRINGFVRIHEREVM